MKGNKYEFKKQNKDPKYDNFREYLMQNCNNYYEILLENLNGEDRYGVVELLAYRIIM